MSGEAQPTPPRARERLRAARFRRRWGFAPPPAWSDWLGYEILLEEIERTGVGGLEGDVLEIGALLGGGTAKLCGWFGRHYPAKLVIAVDVFDPGFDPTATSTGWTMKELYTGVVGERDQRELFDEVTRGHPNLVVLAGDSRCVDVPAERLMFAIVDGSHDPGHVRSDFELAFTRLVPGGIAAFHDYGGDLPGVTRSLHECIGAHADEIARVWTKAPALLFLERAG